MPKITLKKYRYRTPARLSVLLSAMPFVIGIGMIALVGILPAMIFTGPRVGFWILFYSIVIPFLCFVVLKVGAWLQGIGTGFKKTNSKKK